MGIKFDVHLVESYSVFNFLPFQSYELLPELHSVSDLLLRSSHEPSRMQSPESTVLEDVVHIVPCPADICRHRSEHQGGSGAGGGEGG